MNSRGKRVCMPWVHTCGGGKWGCGGGDMNAMLGSAGYTSCWGTSPFSASLCGGSGAAAESSWASGGLFKSSPSLMAVVPLTSSVACSRKILCHVLFCHCSTVSFPKMWHISPFNYMFFLNLLKFKINNKENYSKFTLLAIYKDCWDIGGWEGTAVSWEGEKKQLLPGIMIRQMVRKLGSHLR